MKIRFLIAVSVCTLSLSSQNSKVADLIRQLNNDQFAINHDEKSKFEVKSPSANKLIRKGKKVTSQLVFALDDPERIVMAHYVLCHIYFKHVSFAGPKV